MAGMPRLVHADLDRFRLRKKTLKPNDFSRRTSFAPVDSTALRATPPPLATHEGHLGGAGTYCS